MNMEIPAKLMVDEILKNNVNPYTVLDIYLEDQFPPKELA
jgi:hypothetical protein